MDYRSVLQCTLFRTILSELAPKLALDFLCSASHWADSRLVVPYLLRAEPQRAARYRIMFGNTHSFLPVRNGLVPNTAHIMLHACTAAPLVVLYFAFEPH